MAIGKEVVAYCRVSTLEQKRKGLGMDIQVRDVTAFAQAHNLPLSKIYPDKAESGATENRTQLKKLLRACHRGEVGTVIIPSLDRLSRDVRIAENLFWKFDQLGVHVRIVDMPTYDHRNRRDVLIRQIREAIAEDNRKEIIERLWKGRQERVRRGFFPGGNTPYGYKRHNKVLEIDEYEANIVREIYKTSEKDKAVAIAGELNAAGYCRRDGKPWNARQVADILKRHDLYYEGKIRYGSIVGVNKSLVLIRKNAEK
jgi:site-specific DNA recombinase